jgi:Histidine kinase-, DNA gyrase B-, and HSP90-like ATPase
MTSAASAAGEEATYKLRISRLTIDKLGVRLYDRVSAVVAELVANGHDADAQNVWVHLPLSTVLATKDQDGEPEDKGYKILVRDDGHGMTPKETRDFYLKVGQDRRRTPGQGDRSRGKKRPVMGRKGIGKLAPFGICKRIEVLSSGGDLVSGSGYLTTHFFLDYDQILQDTDEEIVLDAGALDGTYREHTGTMISLTSFLPKRVPGLEDFLRQLGIRFAFTEPDFHIHIRNTRTTPPQDSEVEQFRVETHPETVIDVSDRPVITDEGEVLPVTGWVGMAKQPHKHDEGAGVRVYARGKIVATTRDFEQPAGFTGEYTMRSYLVGEIEANWLDDKEDLIRTDRQAILWDSDRGSALRAWGAKLIREVAKKSAKPRRERKKEDFLDKSKLKERAEERYKDESVVEEVMNLGASIGAFAAEDELDDPDYVNDLAEIILSVAPHRTLVEAFKAIAKKETAPIEELINLFGKTKLAEMASYAQVAAERVVTIRTLERQISRTDVAESDLQALITSAPWLIRPDWSVITANQPLRSFRDKFVRFYKNAYGQDIDVAISYETKRPDFTLIQHGNRLRVVEIKAPGHVFNDSDYERLQNYVAAFGQFFEANSSMVDLFPAGWQIDLIADEVNIRQMAYKFAYDSFGEKSQVVRVTWYDFLNAAIQAHEQILEIYDLTNTEEAS